MPSLTLQNCTIFPNLTSGTIIHQYIIYYRRHEIELSFIMTHLKNKCDYIRIAILTHYHVFYYVNINKYSTGFVFSLILFVALH